MKKKPELSAVNPIGERLVKLRNKKKISIEKLSEMTGLSVKHLEKIEEGNDFAPVGDILKISRALTVSPDDILKSKDNKNERIQGFKRREEAYQYKVLTPEAKDHHLRSFRVTIPPESEHPKIHYQHEGEEFVYTLKGQVEIKVGAKNHHLKKDETLHFNSGIKHSLKNPGKTETVLIVTLYTP
ncbi:MAG: XRE family transcriptional regulator [Spirochaetae bacterium HGW-Spirochaetae-1]|jgi:transcriptional regulator with XRE-family HTH domain|nr:MAG: XRE family transcriptional regulator [Spirochaetae bacterium HGW-Spirochaetae-1]